MNISLTFSSGSVLRLVPRDDKILIIREDGLAIPVAGLADVVRRIGKDTPQALVTAPDAFLDVWERTVRGFFPDYRILRDRNEGVSVDWNQHAQDPEALLLVPLSDPTLGITGTTVAKRDANGRLYGCRDIVDGPAHDGAIEILIGLAEDDGLAIEYRTDRRQLSLGLAAA